MTQSKKVHVLKVTQTGHVDLLLSLTLEMTHDVTHDDLDGKMTPTLAYNRFPLGNEFQLMEFHNHFQLKNSD